MRQLISFVFIFLFLLNVLGYYGLFIGLQYKNTQQANRLLDSDEYNEGEATTLKIPISIPYATDSRDFERVTGEFEYNGEFYRLVKQRLTHDTLYIVCVKDYQSKRIHRALTTYVKTFTDNPTGNHQNHSKSTPTFIKDYLVHTFSFSHKSIGWECEVHKRTVAHFFTSDFYPSIVHPPERA